jgi:uncharacterized protein (DUF885 family)
MLVKSRRVSHHSEMAYCAKLWLVCSALFVLCVSCGQSPSTKTAGPQLQSLLKQEWDYELKASPETATYLGDPRYNAQLSDYSPAFNLRNVEQERAFLREFEAVDPNELSPAEGLNRTLMIRRLREKIEQAEFHPWEMPVDQMNGVHLSLAQLPGYTRFSSVRDYDDYLSRLQNLPRAFSQIEESMRLGVKDHLMPPRYLIEKVVAQAKAIANEKAEANPFAIPLTRFPNSVAPADRSRLKREVLREVGQDVIPTYSQFAEFVQKEYLPYGRVEPGVWSLPNGDARYREAVRRMTTTSFTPEQFHQIGLKQVSEIEQEMLQVANKLGFKDLISFNASIKANKSLYAKSGDQIISLYRKYVDGMRGKMPTLFTHQPKAALEVVPMEAFRAKDGVPADYSPGTADGSRPGRINIDTYDPTDRLTLNIEAIAYHEGIPGHHQQIALAQEMAGLPEFRKNADYNAFVEGWALYAERLGKEVGFYQDPYSEYGRLENEMWRAVRLVVDTGVHYKHWGRQQMVDYFHAHTAMDEPNIETEVDRYIAWPGQALAYKAGQIEILKLRAHAKQELGSRYDLRAFNDAVLSHGALPLDTLDEVINNWIAASKESR